MRVDSCAHHNEPYNVVGNLVKPQKIELVYEPRFAKRMRKRFVILFFKEDQKVGAIKETQRGY
jgi:hypothetical protein